MSDEPTERDVEALMAEHEPVLGRFGGMSGIVGCSCMSARDYRAAGHRAGQGGWRAHVATILAERIAEARREGAADAWNEGWAARAEYDSRRDVPLNWPDRNPYRAAALRGDDAPPPDHAPTGGPVSPFGPFPDGGGGA